MASPCAWALLVDRLEALDDVPMVVAAQNCDAEASDRVRFDRPDLGVWAFLVAEVCADHVDAASRLGGLHVGAIPRHATSGGR
jgi:hypothetical protein